MRKKKLLALLLTLAMLVSMLPMAVLPAAAEVEPEPTVVEAGTWQELQVYLAADDVTSVKLTKNVYATGPDALLVVPAGREVTLDLHGNDIYATYNDTTQLPFGITVQGTLNLKDDYSTGKDCGSIYGAMIGVYVVGGDTSTASFAMYGGDINSNIVGVYMVGGDTSTASFAMYGGKIDWNDVGIMANGSDFTVSGGYIYYNYFGVMTNGGKFTMSGGTIFHNDYIGVMVGIDLEEATPLMEENHKLAPTDLLTILSENPNRAGGTFAMSGGAVEENGIVNVLVSGTYAEGKGYNAALTMSESAAVRATLSEKHDVDYDEYKDPDGIAIGVFALDAYVTMSDSAVICGSYDEEYGYDSFPDSIEIGAIVTNGSFTMKEGAKVTGHNVLGVAAGYAVDEIMKVYAIQNDIDPENMDYTFERRGTNFTMNGATVENNGLAGVLVYGDGTTGSSGTSYNANLSMDSAAIHIGKGLFLEIPVTLKDGKAFDLDLYPQVGLAAVGADVTMDNSTIGGSSETLTPIFQNAESGNICDVLLQLGAIMSNGSLTLGGGSAIQKNNIGGVLMGYPDDLLSPAATIAYLAGGGEKAARILTFAMKYLTIDDSKKTGNALTMASGAKITDNGLFGAFTVGVEENPVQVTMNGASASNNKVVGLAGFETYYVMNDTQVNNKVNNNMMGVLAVKDSTIDIGEGTTISNNTVGAAGIGFAGITLNGGKVTENTKRFTVKGAFDSNTTDSIDELMTGLVGNFSKLFPEAYYIAPIAVRLLASGKTTEGQLDFIVDLINTNIKDANLTTKDVKWLADLLNYGLINSQQTGIVIDSMSSVLDIKSGEISGNANGVSALTVNLNSGGRLVNSTSDETGIHLNGADFKLAGNTTDVAMLMVSSQGSDETLEIEDTPFIRVDSQLSAGTSIKSSLRNLLMKMSTPDVDFEGVLGYIVAILKNMRASVEPLPNVAFTDGLRGKGTAANFTSAISGYTVTLNANGEAMLSKPYTPSGVGGGGSKTYKITVAATENGTATASKSTAAEGEKINVTAKPAEGYELDSIAVKGEKAGTVEVKDGAFTMPADDVTVTVKFKTAEPKTKQTFTDVKPGDWFYEGVEYVAEKGWMQGPGGGVFQPNETTTRAMVAQVLWNMAGKPVVNAVIPFTDVAEGAWYADAVRWAAEKGVVTGWTEADGRQVFDPEGKVTREQFAAMLYRYAKTLGKGFTGLWSFKLDFPDAGDVSDWAIEAMSWMVMNGIINGMDGKLNPQGNSTRAQIAAMLQRFDTLG